ncbi:conserved hypothetical protein [Candidatus Defluviicoccus seviourii]|uniref:TIGR04255 family protein n=1 Tax=Candidatus Defluviicoccus seviourii TaxID=2565273 RepID=A0A564WI20_9PROT|nr:conserved hypothetical protein [Candidatus Defluviicoccus seviourii]
MSETTSTNYPRPPITEAVIELRIAAEIGDREQKKVVERLNRYYPHSQSMQGINLSIDATGGQVGLQQHMQGYRLSSEDQTDVVLVMPQGIASARLAPYPGWPALCDRAKAAWDVWRQETPHHPVSRIGTRYINRIDIPFDDRPAILIADYLTLYPHIPASSIKPMLGYMMEVGGPVASPNWTATIRSARVMPPPIPNHMSLLLDIDVFRTEEIPLRDDCLWDLINTARDIKNGIFESCITDHSRRLFGS